ncbi:Flagellar motor switch protein, partial [Gilliamella apicola SCGC AB-598-B02]
MSDKREPITDINGNKNTNPVSGSSIATKDNVTDTNVVSLPSGKKADVKPYDLSVKHSFVPERLTALEIINERFARQFRIGLFNLLRRNTDVIASPIETQNFKYFSDISSTY